MGHSPRILVCEHDDKIREQLARKLDASGFWVDSVGTARDALRNLETHRYDAMTLSLVLGDQDALTFLQDLKILYIDLPILVTSIRNERRSATPLLMQNMDADFRVESEEPEPEWVRKAADQARIIFAIKTACSRSRNYRPRILHIEPDAFNSGLMNAAVRKNSELVQVNRLEDLQDALCSGPFDLVLLNPLFADEEGESALHQVANAYPNVPIVLHTEYVMLAAEEDLLPINSDSQNPGFGLVQALQNLVLYGFEVPRYAHA